MAELPGLERVKARFIEMLIPRQEKIAAHAVLAWDGQSSQEICDNLAAAQAILHQIAGSAGSLGFADLGVKAHNCENEIIDYLNGPDAELAICPGVIIQNLDQFLQDCRIILGHAD